MASTVVNTNVVGAHTEVWIKDQKDGTVYKHRIITQAPAGRTGGNAQWLIDAQTEFVNAFDTSCKQGPSGHKITGHLR